MANNFKKLQSLHLIDLGLLQQGLDLQVDKILVKNQLHLLGEDNLDLNKMKVTKWSVNLFQRKKQQSKDLYKERWIMKIEFWKLHKHKKVDLMMWELAKNRLNS